jgi:hypothetical protein
VTPCPVASWPERAGLGLRCIVSGGEPGVARTALDWAIARGLAHGGWCRAGRKCDDGVIGPRYALREVEMHRGTSYIRANVLCSDATLILNIGVLDGWPQRTVGTCQRARKPLLVVQLDDDRRTVCDRAQAWLANQTIDVLHITGPLESKRPGIGTATLHFLDRLASSIDTRQSLPTP